MKKNFKLLSMLLIGMMAAFVLACNDDDENENGGGTVTKEDVTGEEVNLPTPKYTNDAAIFTVTTPGSEYKSIELTESGYAVITLSGYDSRMATRGIMTSLMPEDRGITRMKTRSDDDDYSYTPQCYWLRYEKTGDGTYRMWHIVGSQAGKEWGTLKVTKDNPNSPVNVELEITRANGYPQVIQTRWENLWKDDPASESICRSWEPEKITIDFVKTQGSNKKTVKKEFSGFKAYYQWILDELMNGKKPADLGISEYPQAEEYFEIPVQILFTRSGTYIVFYDDGTAQINNWVWAEHEPPYKTIHYSHDLNNLYKDGASGNVTHSYDYDGKRGIYILKIAENSGTMRSFDSEFTLTGTSVYHLRPVQEK